MPKKKQFIDKKKAVTFHLVHRSQKDPLQADEEAPQRVLVSAEEPVGNNRIEEQRKFGIFYEDEYDYLQHLKDVDEINDVEAVQPTVHLKETNSAAGGKVPLQLPSVVFGSVLEEETGLLNKATPLIGPQLDWDPDIVAALDEDFDFENPDNQIEDDFIQIANVEGNNFTTSENVPGDRKLIQGESGQFQSDDDVGSDEAEFSDGYQSDTCSVGEQSFEDLETKTRFTNYSMSSSVMKRNEGLTLLDDRFEKFYEQYDDEDIGALDHEDIGGNVSKESELLNNVMAEFEKQQAQKKLKDVVQKGEDVEVVSESDSDNSDLVKMVIEDKKEQWDCESILSTYSNIYNHPQTIKEPTKVKPIQLTKRAAIPSDVLPERGLTRKQIENDGHAMIHDHANTYRPRDETTEERKFRKKAIKDERKARREQKKATKDAFKEEKKQQQKIIVNVQNNLQGMKIV